MGLSYQSDEGSFDMTTTKTLSRAEILALPLDQPEGLFETPDAVAFQFKQLAKRWHPDVQNGDAEVFAHVNLLHVKADEKIAAGEWHIPGLLQVVGIDGITRRIKYAKSFDCGLGQAYIGKSLITYVLNKDYVDLVETARQTIKNLKFPNTKEREQLAYCLPTIKTSFETADSIVLVIEKPEDIIRLRDLLEYYNGKIDPKHVSWMINRLLNLCCFLTYNKISHGDLSLDTVFISPQFHSAVLLGGWWYSVPLDSRMARVQPVRTLVYAPHSVLKSKKASTKIDLELVRLIGRETLGDETGVKLATDTTIPKAMTEWLRSATTGDAVADYTRWPEILFTSFGPRRFVPMAVTSSDIYKEF
jgi:hypothetical protein